MYLAHEKIETGGAAWQQKTRYLSGTGFSEKFMKGKGLLAAAAAGRVRVEVERNADLGEVFQGK